MRDAYCKTFRTVIMDGTDSEIVGFIVNDLIDDLNRESYGKSTCRPLDDKHPSMIVVETYTREHMYNEMRDLIDRCYPGLCIFNPPI